MAYSGSAGKGGVEVVDWRNALLDRALRVSLSTPSSDHNRHHGDDYAADNWREIDTMVFLAIDRCWIAGGFSRIGRNLGRNPGRDRSDGLGDGRSRYPPTGGLLRE